MELTQRIDSLRHITEVLDEASRGKTEVKEAATSTSAEVSTQTDTDTAGRWRNSLATHKAIYAIVSFRKCVKSSGGMGFLVRNNQ